ncbi:MAG: FtsX-like permease family protein [Allomuricauda sp.]
MWRNEIKLAQRKLWHKKRSSLTKLFSLILGTVCLFYISIYIHQELSFDTFHKNTSKIVKVNTAIKSPTGDLALGLTAIPVGPYLKSNAPQVQDFVRINKAFGNHAIKQGNKVFSESENIYYADPSFFKLFDFNVLTGNKESALEGPNNMVLTRRAAMRYFGTVDALNKVLIFDGEPYTITGIVENLPSNSHLQFDFLISMETFLKDRSDANDNWGWFPMNTYLLLNDAAAMAHIGEALKKVPEYQERADTEDQYFLSAEPMKGLHFSEVKLGELGPKEKRSNLYILFGIGLMILLLAISNFINLTTAQVSVQGKDVSIKKTLGASKKDVFRQFFIESTVLTALATFIAMAIIVLSFSYFEDFVGYSVDISFLSHPLVFIALPLIPIVLSLMGGIYPAIMFARIPSIYAPVLGSKPSSPFNMRNSLLAFQFSITSILIICSVIIYHQLDFVRSQDLGMDTKQKLVLDYGSNAEIGNSYEALKEMLGEIPGVESVTFSSHVPGQIPNGVYTQITDVNGKRSSGEINLNLVDYDFIQDYGLQMIAGRGFRREDAAQDPVLILNEAAVHAFGYDDPEDILGASFEQWGGNGRVVGVIKDFNYLSLHEDVGLLSLKIWPEQFMKITFEIAEANIGTTLNSLETKWASLYPDIPFNHYFVDDNFRAQYEKDEQFSMIINVFTIISLCIGILGLVAYANFWCERRRKEMSIRKVLGANISRLIWNLYQGFSLPVLFGFFLAVPVSYYFANQWLQGFAYKFELNWHFFVVPFIILLLFVWMAVGMQTIRLAISNPVDALKEE